MTFTELAKMLPGDEGVVCGFQPGSAQYRRKLLAMGLTPNTRFQVIRRAPLGDPIQIKVRDFFLSLRQDEAVLLKIRKLGAV